MSRRSYPTDITDAPWELVEPLLPKPRRRGPKANVNLREILNGIFYLLHEGCQWRALPNDLPPWPTVYSYFRKWQKKGIWEKLNEVLREQVRISQGRNPQTSAGSIDSQSVKTTQKKGEVYEFDGGKKVKGRKRHILVDSQGLLIELLVTEANFPKRLGGVVLVSEGMEKVPDLRLIWVDQGYSGENFSDSIAQLNQAKVEVVKRKKKNLKFCLDVG